MITRTTLVALSLCFVAACGSEAPPPTSAAPTTVAAAPPPTSAAPAAPVEPDPAAIARATATGELARAIVHDPEHATAALEGAHLTQAEFEERVYAIAADPALSAAYRTALDAP
jgi:hypothetical protein